MNKITTTKPTFNLNRSTEALGVIGEEFPLELIEDDSRTALLTLAFMFSNGSAMRCDQFGLATTQLALYAAAPFAQTSVGDYDALRATVAEYHGYCVSLAQEHRHFGADVANGYERMASMLAFILESAATQFTVDKPELCRKAVPDQ